MEEGNVRYRFCANVWCRVIEGQIMGQFILERRLIRAHCVGVAEGGGRLRFTGSSCWTPVTLAAGAGMCSCTSSVTEYPPYQSACNAVSELSLNGYLVWPWGSQNWPPYSPDLNPPLHVCEYGRGLA